MALFKTRDMQIRVADMHSIAGPANNIVIIT